MRPDPGRGAGGRAVPFGAVGYALVVLACAVYVGSLVLRPTADYLPAFDVGLKLPVEFGAAVLALVGGLRRTDRGTRAPWAWMLGFAMLVWTVGDLLFTVASPSGASPPSPDDIFFIAFYPLAYVAVLIAVHREARDIPTSSWMDGLLAALGCATLVATLGVDQVLRSSSTTLAGAVVELAYPIGDLALLSLVVGVFGVIPHANFRRHLPWTLILGGCALFAASDTFYLVRSSGDGYLQGSIWDAGWTVALVLMSGSAWVRSPVPAATRPGPAHIVLPGIAAAVGFGVLVYGGLRRLDAVDVVLAGATMITAAVRAILLLRRLGELEAERRLRLVAEESSRRLAQQEEENRTLALRLAGLVDAAPVGIVEVDQEGLIRRWNRAAERIYGWSEHEVVGRPDPNPVVPVRDAASGQSARGADQGGSAGAVPDGAGQHVQHVGKDGRLVAVELAVAALGGPDGPGGLLKVVSDVSERVELELQLRHAQKLETVGRLAEGLAHELNTPIQFVGDGVEFLATAMSGLARLQELAARLRAGTAPAQEQVQDLWRTMDEVDLAFLADEGPGAADSALDGVRRMSEIVRAMGVFGRPGETLRRWVDLNEAVRAVLIIAGPRISLVADVTTDLGDLPAVMCHPGDVNHVLFDVMANAADAMADVQAERGRGRLHVVTRAQADAVVVEVSDTGCGITDEVAGRIFDPFFTTKPVGRGMGQGLSVARTLIVGRHHGTLDFSSRPGEGTTFRIVLPLE